MYNLKIIYFLTFLCLMTCNNSIANIESDQVQDGISKLANSNGNQNELKSNEDVKAVETGIILLIDHCTEVCFASFLSGEFITAIVA